MEPRPAPAPLLRELPAKGELRPRPPPASPVKPREASPKKKKKSLCRAARPERGSVRCSRTALDGIPHPPHEAPGWGSINPRAAGTRPCGHRRPPFTLRGTPHKLCQINKHTHPAHPARPRTRHSLRCRRRPREPGHGRTVMSSPGRAPGAGPVPRRGGRYLGSGRVIFLLALAAGVLLLFSIAIR